MLPLDLVATPRTRKELLVEYPQLGGAIGAQHRVADECLELLALFARFGRGIAPLAKRIDEEGNSSSAAEALALVLDAACQHRLFSLAIPRSLGGSGYSMLALSVGLECLAQVCVGVANLVAAHGLSLAVVGATGRVRLLRMLAEKIVAGERNRNAFLLATAATEPSAGSDLEDFDAMSHAVFESHADASHSGYRLHGRKIYVSNGSLASAYVVIMPTDRNRARDTLSAFLVFADAAHGCVVRDEEKLGQRACPAAELFFDGCFVPGEQRLNEGSIAGRTLDLVLGASRSTVGAFGAGIARGVFASSVRILNQLRGADGRPLVEHPSAKAELAAMWSNAAAARNCYIEAAYVQRRCGLVALMESEALRALDRIVPARLARGALAEKLLSWEGIDREARRVLNHLDAADIGVASLFGSAAKIRTSEFALANCGLAQSLLGVEASREDSGIPKYWRDARLLSIYEGTNEICSLDVAQKLLARHP